MKLKLLLCSVSAMFFVTTDAAAATINLIDQGGTAGTAVGHGLETAALYWSSILTNDVTINLGVGFSQEYAGAADPVRRAYALQDWERQIALTRSDSTLDRTAILPTLTGQGGATFITNEVSADGRVDTAQVTVVDGATTSSRMLYASTAVLKAIGAIDARDTAIDSTMVFSPWSQLWDFDPTDGIDAMKVDFLAVAIHEIGHAVGFFSGVDTLDEHGDPKAPETAAYDLSGTPTFSALDMFRYSDDPLQLVDGDQPMLDLSVGTSSYFSIDGGRTALFGDAGFSTGRYNGDGSQASHWRLFFGESYEETCYGQIGVMAASVCPGVVGTVTALDLAAFDAIGWNTSFDVIENSAYRASTADIYRQFQSAIPEPTSWAMMLTGFAMVGGALRGGRRTKVKGAFAG